MLRKITFSLLVVLLVGIFTINVFAAPEKSTLQTVLARGYLIVGTGSANVPWHFKNEQGQLVGMDIDMARILAKGLFDDPTKVEFVEESADARIANLVTGKVDIVLQFMTISPARLQKVTFSAPYYVEGLGLLLPANGKYKNYEEMVAAIENGKTVTIAILQNIDAENNVQAGLKGAVCAQYESQGLMYAAIMSGRADAACTGTGSIKWLSTRESEKYLDSGRAYNPQNYAAAMRLEDQLWINYVNGVFLEAMCGRRFQLYIDAYAKWFGEELPVPKFGKPQMYR